MRTLDSQKKEMSISWPLLPTIATCTGPVATVPKSTTPDHSWYPAFCPTLLTVTLEKVCITGLKVPICPTGAFSWMTGAILVEPRTAAVKLTTVVEVVATEVIDRTMKVSGCVGKTELEMLDLTANAWNKAGCEIGRLNGKNAVVPNTFEPSGASGLRVTGVPPTRAIWTDEGTVADDVRV
jgi:hypothetical protein